MNAQEFYCVRRHDHVFMTIYVVNVYARQTGKNPNKLFEFGAKILLQGK